MWQSSKKGDLEISRHQPSPYSLILKVESGNSNYSSHLREKAQDTVKGVSPVMSESLNKSQPPTVPGRGLTG